VTRQCLDAIKVPAQTQSDIFTLLAAVLHLGNVHFEERSSSGSSSSSSGSAAGTECCIAGSQAEAALAFAAQALGVQPAGLKSALCTKQLHVGGNTVVQQQSVEQARDKRDALAKAVYSQLFVWLVGALNRTISAPPAVAAKPGQASGTGGQWGFIGVLDIYGFEKFETNGFEQLLINYANEK
jgi:myosin heavy subunit